MTETVINVEQVPPSSSMNKGPTTTSQSQPLDWIRINVDYFKTIPGIVKVIEFIIGIVCMCLASPHFAGTEFFIAVVTVSFILTLLWIVVYFLGVREALTLPFDWILTEFWNTVLLTVLYFIAFIIQFITWSPKVGSLKIWNILAAIFGMINTGVYAFGAYLLNLEWKNRN